MKQYQTPEVHMISLELTDILTASTTVNDPGADDQIWDLESIPFE